MKVIDLLNRIANGEEVPEKIRFDDMIWNKMCGEKNIYYVNEYDSDLFVYLFRRNLTFSLNDEVETIEEDKKIEPLINCINDIRPNEMSSYYEKEKLEDIVKQNFYVIHKKINEIIDKLNKENK